jgi:hypothetical protein
MAQRTIRFLIRPDGRVEEQVEGVAGEGCMALCDRIESRLGSVQQRRPTAEAYQSTASISAQAHQALSQPS